MYHLFIQEHGISLAIYTNTSSLWEKISCLTAPLAPITQPAVQKRDKQISSFIYSAVHINICCACEYLKAYKTFYHLRGNETNAWYKKILVYTLCNFVYLLCMHICHGWWYNVCSAKDDAEIYEKPRIYWSMCISLQYSHSYSRYKTTNKETKLQCNDQFYQGLARSKVFRNFVFCLCLPRCLQYYIFVALFTLQLNWRNNILTEFWRKVSLQSYKCHVFWISVMSLWMLCPNMHRRHCRRCQWALWEQYAKCMQTK